MEAAQVPTSMLLRRFGSHRLDKKLRATGRLAGLAGDARGATLAGERGRRVEASAGAGVFAFAELYLSGSLFVH